MLAWPDPVGRSGAKGRGRAIAKAGGGSRRHPAATLADHRILVASSPGQISGVDVFACHLVRQLRGRGLDARLHGRQPADPAGPLAYPEDLPLDELDPALGEPSVGWLNRWRALAAHLERLAPCIYVPNYDVDYSCACPLFSDSVKMVGIVHSDDPWHYEHLSRIGPFCDAVVGVSTAISRHVAALDPSYGDRLRTIPYGITLPACVRATDEERPPNAPLRIVFTGRLMRQQKRAEDVVAVALELAARGVPFEMIVVGDGTARKAMEWAGRRLILDRRLWFTGTLPNEDVLSILSSCDALLLPSAFEGLSVGMLEAMARGVVPVVSDIRSGVPDAVRHGENGFIAPVGDTSRFADHLQRLQQDPALRRRMAAAAAETIPAGRFQLEDMIGRYVDLFTWVVENPRSRPGGAVVPPGHLREEASWRLWARRIAADPLASMRRVANRLSRGGETGRRVSTGPPG
jgi:glycosyltransferase involved in cell wall biosynthesis